MSDEEPRKPYVFLPPPDVLEELERRGWRPGDPPLEIGRYAPAREPEPPDEPEQEEFPF